MKNKIFFQLNPFWQILCIILLGIGAIGLYTICWACVEVYYTSDFIALIPLSIALFGVFYSLYSFIRLEHSNIFFKEQYFYIPDDWMWKKEKVQYKTVVDYSQIIDIKLIRSPFNSK